MSFKAIDDINNSVADKVKTFRKKNAQIRMPKEIKPHIDSISEKGRCYMADFEEVNAEANAHQEGGQFRSISSPQNMTVPTVFMQGVRHSQTEHKQMMAQKCTEVEKVRESIKRQKKETDEEIRRLYDSLVTEFQERRTVSS